MLDRLPPNVKALTCILCGGETRDPWRWECPRCGPASRMDVVYHPRPWRLDGRPFDMWRYREVLPLPEGARLPPVQVGGSPLSEAPRLAEHLGVRRLWLKDDGRNPSASLKDRPSALGVVMAVAAGRERISCASTGNAASSTACIAASMGLAATIFVPKRAPAPKVAQLRVFGAQVFRVDADYDRTWDLAAEIASRRPWYDRNCAVNPYLVEGKKTAALELAEQLGADMPAWVALSVGDGCTYAGVVKGLEEAHAAGIIPHVPRVLGAQAEGARPLVDALDGDGLFRQKPAESVADSICVGHPRNFRKALDAARRNGGRFVAVPDSAIVRALVDAARLGGVFGEPAASATVAAVAEAVRRGIVAPEEGVAVIVTGNGLKDTATALSAVDGPIDVPASAEAVERVLG